MTAFSHSYVTRVLLATRRAAYGFDPAFRQAPWLRASFDPYRPELHYMRGPGPKWREKHGQR
jgi:hypothetical protein